MGPGLSMLKLMGMTPYRLTRPKVGRSPDSPHRVDGKIMDPRVSVPMEKPTRPAAVAAPGPAEEPRVPSWVFQGVTVWPPNQMSPEASSPVLNLATSTAPAASSRSTMVAS